MEEVLKRQGELMKTDLVGKDYAETIDLLSSEVIKAVKESDIKMYNPTLLAYIGDAVYELFIRTTLISKGNSQTKILHKKAVLFVKAKSQASIIEKIYDDLTDEEKHIVRSGRNAKTTSMPKNAKIMEYKYATGFEALLGYLYLNNKIERLLEILHFVVENTDLQQ